MCKFYLIFLIICAIILNSCEITQNYIGKDLYARTALNFKARGGIMKDIKSIVSQNLSALRRERGITQAELAEKLNYSDKAISRWEKGDTLPDLNVLHDICEFYGITMNDLTSEECTAPQKDEAQKNRRMYRIWSCIVVAASTWFLATLCFFSSIVLNATPTFWIAFVWALPVSCGVVMLIGRQYYSWIVHFVLGSVLTWSAITAIILTFIYFTPLGSSLFWILYIVGVPIQAMIFFSQMAWKTRKKVKIHKKKKKEEENASRTEESNLDTGSGK